MGYLGLLKISLAEGINILKQAGAIPVLAHSGFLNRDEPVSEGEIVFLIIAGLSGLEVFYSKYTAE